VTELGEDDVENEEYIRGADGAVSGEVAELTAAEAIKLKELKDVVRGFIRTKTTVSDTNK
jgi:hypothetical protein